VLSSQTKQRQRLRAKRVDWTADEPRKRWMNYFRGQKEAKSTWWTATVRHSIDDRCPLARQCLIWRHGTTWRFFRPKFMVAVCTAAKAQLMALIWWVRGGAAADRGWLVWSLSNK
jgi:hypothetical protein